MNDDPTLALRVLSTAAFDWGLAVICGSLLAAFWLRNQTSPSPLRRLRLAALLTVAALTAQFYLLTAAMTGQSSIAQVAASAPLVASTHAGSVTLATLGICAVLFLASLLVRTPLQTSTLLVFTTLLLVILALHAATGHAANDGNFSLAELLQFLHLTAMACWTGGILISALLLVPSLPANAPDRTYLQSLSTVSAWSVAIVLVTGSLKGWTGLDHHLGGLLHPGWGGILSAKLLFVAIALGLGAQHRRSLRRPDWTDAAARTFRTTLRIEALCLSLVILLSAWLASVDPSSS